MAAAVNAAYVLAVQLLALVVLDPTSFGAFSLQYLLFAFSASVCLSVVSEPWLRRELHEASLGSRHAYMMVLTAVAGIAGIVTLIVSVSIPALREIAIPGTIAVAAATHRSGARYRDVRESRWGRVVTSDALGFAVTLAIWFGWAAMRDDPLLGVSVAWAAGALASAAVSPPVGIPRVADIRRWVHDYRSHIGPLLRDSLLMDLGAIGTPFALAPLLGITGFGVYRAVSNVAAPVRLSLNPIRPLIAAQTMAVHRSTGARARAIVVGVGFGVACYLALLGLLAFDVEIGALTAVADFALPASVFVTANFVGHYYYIVARAHSVGGSLFAGRLVQTALAIILPLAGVMLGGLPGAIWALAVATVASASVWFGLVQRRSA